jgi:hypothetical protein
LRAWKFHCTKQADTLRSKSDATRDMSILRHPYAWSQRFLFRALHDTIVGVRSDWDHRVHTVVPTHLNHTHVPKVPLARVMPSALNATDRTSPRRPVPQVRVVVVRPVATSHSRTVCKTVGLSREAARA